MGLPNKECLLAVASKLEPDRYHWAPAQAPEKAGRVVLVVLVELILI